MRFQQRLSLSPNLFLGVFAITTLFANWVDAQDKDWRTWRGPSQDGTARFSGFFEGERLQLRKLWSVDVGSAYSTTTISDGRIFTMFNRGNRDYLGAFDLHEGELLWQVELGPIYKAHDGGHDGPVSTPIENDGVVYALGPRGKLWAVTASFGNVLWSVQMDKEYQAPHPFWGFASSPVVYENLLLVQIGGAGKNGIVALEKSTGKFVWGQPCGRVDYRSPVLAQVQGQSQLIVSGPDQTTGHDPKNGDVLWSWSGGIKNDKTPLVIDQCQILLVRNGCELIELDESGRNPKRIWKSREFSGNFDVPVAVDGFLYGFTGSYLTCLDQKDGKRLWRSRPPGGMGIISVEGKLIALGDKGDVVVIDASPTGYRELARLNVSDGAGYSWPSFSNNVIVVRNLRHLVALTPQPIAAEPVTNMPSNQLEQFVAQVNASDDKHAFVEKFLAEHPTSPWFESDNLAHFFFHGPAEDVGIAGTMLASSEADQLIRIDGTQLFYRSYEIEAGTRWEYEFIVDFDGRTADPRNPMKSRSSSNRSVVVSAGWNSPEFSQDWSGPEPGEWESFRFSPVNRQYACSIDVYMPAGKDLTKPRPLLIVMEGPDWIESGRFKDVMYHVFEKVSNPPVVAFVPGFGGREFGGNGTQEFSTMLAENLIPELRRRYFVTDGAGNVSLLAKRGAAVAAVYSAVRFPDVIGQCAVVSFGRADTVRRDMIFQRIKQSRNANRASFYIGWCRYDVWRPQSFDCRLQSRELLEQLKNHGFVAVGIEHRGSANWEDWRIQGGEALIALYSESE